MRRLLVALCAAVGVVSAGCGDDDEFEYVGEPGAPVPASFASWVPAVDVSVGEEPARSFLVDTGAPLTMVDTDAFPELEDGLHEVELGGFELLFPSLSIAAFDVFGYEQDAESEFVGIVGGDILSEFALRLDYRDDRVWLDELPGDEVGLPAGVEAASVGVTQTVPLRVRGGGRAVVPGDCPVTCGTIRLPPSRALVEVFLEEGERPVWMLVDTGASAVVLDEATLEALPAEGRPRLDGVTVGTASGPVTAYFTRVSSLGLQGGAAGEESVPVLVLSDDALFEGIERETGLEVRGLIGGTFLRSYLTTIDFPEERLALARYVEQSHIDADEFVRVGFTMIKRAGGWEAQDVYPGTDAAADGLLSGEVLADLDGEAISAMDQAAVSAILGRFDLGEEVPVGVVRGADTEVLHIEVEDLLPQFEAP